MTYQTDGLTWRADYNFVINSLRLRQAVGTLSGPAIYYRRTDPQAVQQGQATAHGRVHDIAASDDRYCGLLAWTGFDYPSGSGNQYRGVKYTGVVDLFRGRGKVDKDFLTKLEERLYLAELNGQHVKLVKFQGEFVWHKHDDTDDFFLVLKGVLDIELRDRTVAALASASI